uniref:Uncharacterized protein n=1 Tax=Anguilla anguilla TaxID=7936 RepID=A0A0E9PWD5_ANGAN
MTARNLSVKSWDSLLAFSGPFSA